MQKFGIVILVLIVGAVAFYMFLTGQNKEAGGVDSEEGSGIVELVFEETEFDFGVVKQSGGLITHEFAFTYIGDIERTVLGAPTSCGCTEAEVSVDILQQGTSGVVTVTFDPNLHAEPEGKFFKSIYVLTNPELEEEIELKIWVEIDVDLGSEAFKLKMHDDDHDDNHADGQVFHSISASDLKSQLYTKDFFLMDVHIPEQEHIDSTDTFIPFNEIRKNLGKLPEDKDAKIVVYCRSGSMSKFASEELVDLGYTNVYDLEGGINAFNSL